MLRTPPEQNDSFTDFIDSIKNLTIRRAGEKTDWNDIWIGLLRSETYYKVLRERGVDTFGMRNEIEFLTNFPEFAKVYLPKKKLNIQKTALAELSKDISTTLRFMENEAPEEEKILHLTETYKMLQIALGTRSRQILDNKSSSVEDIIERGKIDEVKGQIVGSLLQYLMKMSIDEPMEDGLRRIVAEDPITKAQYKVDAAFEKEILRMLEKEIQFYLRAGKGIQIIDHEDPLQIIEAVQQHPHMQPSAAVVVDTIIEESGEFFKALLYRNGLPSADLEYKDALAGKLPDHEIQAIMGSAYSFAFSSGAKTLSPHHVAYVLSRDNDVQVHLRALGIADLSEFQDKFYDLMEKTGEKAEKNIRVRTQISPDIYALISRLETLYKKEESKVPLLLDLIKTDKTVDTAFNKAGLKRAQLKDWPKKYLEEKAATKKANKGKKKKDRKEDEPQSIFDILFGGMKKNEGPYEVSDEYFESQIKKYCIDYTKRAKAKKFDPMIGNEDVVEDVITILQKRGKKNPILIGEPGIGKTKVLEGLATRIIKGNVPKQFIGARLLMLDLTQMNDTPYVGVFEERVLSIVKAAAERNALGKLPPILLGIDELGENMDRGGHQHSSGFKGVIKPYLTTGDVFMIGNATQEEYNTRIEKDSAFARRFQPVLMSEPTTEHAANILLGQKTKFSSHHKIRIPNHLMTYIAENAGRYIQTVKQPDKSIDTLDEACAIAKKQGAKTLQKEHINLAISSKTGIPVSFLSQNDRERYATIERELGKKIFDQPQAIEEVSGALKRARARIGDPQRPIGNFLFVGPTGVGKTELTKAIAEFMFGGSDERFLNRFDMGEYQEKNSVNMLNGSPSGYVGYEEGGKLVKAVRRRPYSVNLFDEAEKAHPDIFNALLSPLSSATMTDGRGIKADFRNTVNIFTVNLGAQEIAEKARQKGLDPFKDFEEWQAMAQPIYKYHVESFFKAEFRNRMDGIIYFNSLRKETLRKLVKREFERTASQVQGEYGLELDIAQPFMDAVAKDGFDVRNGARPLKRVWQKTIETPMADWLLRQSALSLRKSSSLSMALAQASNDDASGVVTSFRRLGSKVAEPSSLQASFVLKKSEGPI